MMQSKRNKKLFLKAFTLLELLVAITLMNLIALTLYSSMYIGVKAKKSSTEALKPYRIVVPAYESIKKDLQSALEPIGVFAGSFVGEDAAGENQSDSITFYCCNYLPQEGEKASNIIKVVYSIEADELKENSLVLIRKKTTNLLSSKTAETEDEVVCRDVYSFNVKYYDGYNWTDSWDSTTNYDQLPRAIQISLSVVDEGDYGDKAEENAEQINFIKTILLPYVSENTD